MAIEATAEALVALWGRRLSGVAFPDVDAELLARALRDLEAAERAVQEAELALEAARCAEREARAVLRRRAQRGVAYARIYAEGDAELTAELEALDAPRVRRARPEEPSSPPPAHGRRLRRSQPGAPLLEGTESSPSG